MTSRFLGPTAEPLQGVAVGETVCASGTGCGAGAELGFDSGVHAARTTIKRMSAISLALISFSFLEKPLPPHCDTPRFSGKGHDGVGNNYIKTIGYFQGDFMYLLITSMMPKSFTLGEI